MALISNIIFMNPWILLGAAGLPLLWFLLRIMPPTPQRIVLPTTRFLAGLVPETQTPSRTPWWILLLRIAVAALVLLALAQPVYNPAGGLPGSGAVRLVIDNSWPAAQTWSKQIQAAEESLMQAGREKREIYILTTTPPPGEKKPVQYGPLSYTEGLPILRGLKPYPWPASYKGAKEIVEERPPQKTVTSMWFSHGLNEGGIDKLITPLQAQGGLHYISPTPGNLPLLLRMPEKAGYAIQAIVDAPSSITPGRPVTVQALAEDGRVLDRQNITLEPDKLPTTVTFDVPETLRNNISQFRFTGKAGAGGILLLDERHRKRSVGIVSPPEKAETAPLVEAGYYLKRALDPFTTLHFGDIPELVEQDPSVIILPDIASMPPETLNMLEDWVKKGGLLLRFAGPNMTQNQSDIYLLPVPIRKSRRSLDGSLTWQEPVKVMPFPENSPLYGLDVPGDITVSQQILPDASQDLDQKIWSTLSDGTPLVTASPLDQGLLVFVHTTATPAWSDLALSGLFVEILQRIISISGTSASQNTKVDGYLEPRRVLDGFGSLQDPESFVQSILAEDFKNTKPDSTHPPGLYGRGGYQQALNTGEHIDKLRAATNLPTGVFVQHYGSDFEINLMPLLLYAALILLLADWLIMILIAGNGKLITKRVWRSAGTAAIVLALLITPLPAKAQGKNYADGLYLAYMRTGDTGLDSISHRGLESLAEVLARRTSVEPDGVAGLNPEYDELAFFPIIYWPVTTTQTKLSQKALNNVQHYLDHGGTILFDTRDRNYTAGSLSGTKNTESLQIMTSALNLPPLMPIPEGHVLGKSFYLLDSFPGRYTGGTLWVAQESANSRDGVSSIIIGSHDWASAWAAGRGTRSSMGGSHQQEMAQRFGVNLVLYALTGNYKADQVHVPFILERLGQ
ncbi:MAG: LytTR family transcriptional regulator [Micavibrio sp.]|nr:MAG: LytTR family transcriptional regulator [Micavibrio sp.]